jgi:hypothetical protein
MSDGIDMFPAQRLAGVTRMDLRCSIAAIIDFIIVYFSTKIIHFSISEESSHAFEQLLAL